MPGLAPADPTITVVVPMLDAADRVPALGRWAHELHERVDPEAEVILVDDGSRDGTWAATRALTATEPRIRGLRLARNVGQTGALCAGFTAARAPIVMMIDDDLECGPDDVATFAAAIAAGADFASGRRLGRRPPLRAAAAWAYNQRLSRWGLPFRDAGCGVNGLTRALAQRIATEGWAVHQHRFKPRVATMAHRIVEVSFAARETRGSHFSTLDLGASWLDVEIVVGGLDPRRFAAAAIAAPALVAVGAAGVARRSRRPEAAGLAAASAVVAATSARVLALRSAHERRVRGRPAFEVAETAP